MAMFGFVSSARAYPAGTDLTLNVRSVVTTHPTHRIEFVVRHAAPHAQVNVVFEDVHKSLAANTSGIAVFSFISPVSGVHVAAATSGGARVTARQYIERFRLGRYSAPAGTQNWISIESAKPGTVLTVVVAGKNYNAVVNRTYGASVFFPVPRTGNYSIRVFCNAGFEMIYSAIAV
jgi:hypothetical protein